MPIKKAAGKASLTDLYSPKPSPTKGLTGTFSKTMPKSLPKPRVPAAAPAVRNRPVAASTKAAFAARRPTGAQVSASVRVPKTKLATNPSRPVTGPNLDRMRRR